MHRFTCPRGAYLDTSPTTLAEKERVLQGHVQKLLQDGYELMPGWETGVRLAGRRMWTFSDPMWPKPAHCREVWGDAAAIYNDCVTTSTGRMTVNHGYHLMIRLVTKAASTTILETATKMLKGTQAVNYYAGVPGKGDASCHRRANPNIKEAHVPYSGQRYLLLGNVREPMGRFISAFNHFAGLTGHRSGNRVANFMDVLRNAFECANYAWGTREWNSKGFIHFLPAVGFFLLPHLLYAGANETVPYIDKLFRLEEIGELVPYLERARAGAVVAGPGSAGRVKQQVLAKKTASKENVQPHEPLTALLMKALSEQPDMVRIHCRAFIQDYVCFDYPLPKECADLLVPANYSFFSPSYLPALSKPAIMPSINLAELDKLEKDLPFMVDLPKLNRFLLVIIGVLMATASWQRYKLTSMTEEDVEERLP